MAPVTSTITRVLVTGFGPFSGVPNNPSWGIASRLPSALSAESIELIVHPAYVPVAYHPVIDLIPTLISDHQPDLALHMGVAAGRNYFAVEQTSRKDGYQWARDVDNQVFTVEEQNAIWGQEELVLTTDLDLRSVVANWQNGTSSINWPVDMNEVGESAAPRRPVDVKMVEDVMDTDDVRWSDEIGNYLCGFIYYTDLVEMKKHGKNKKRDVAFMHVPSLNTEEELQMGVDVAVELVKAMVQTWREQKAA